MQNLEQRERNLKNQLKNAKKKYNDNPTSLNSEIIADLLNKIEDLQLTKKYKNKRRSR